MAVHRLERPTIGAGTDASARSAAFRPADFPFIAAIRGRVGDCVYKTNRGKVIVTRVPRFDGYVPSSAQRARRDRMREATVFAQRIYATPVAKAFYAAAAEQLGRQPFRLAVSDYLVATSAAENRVREA